MRRRRRNRKPIGKPSGLSDKERRMRRERERLDRPRRERSNFSIKKGVDGTANILGWIFVVGFTFIFILGFLFFLFTGINVF